MHHLLQVHQGTRRHRVVVADDAVGQLMDPFVGHEVLDLHAVLKHPGQEVRARRALVLGQELAQAIGAALLGRHARQDHIVAHAARFLHGELAQQEEGVARFGGNPVGIAAARVQHGQRGRLLGVLGQRDQIILKFKGRQLLQVALARAGGFQAEARLTVRGAVEAIVQLLLVCD